MKTSSAKSKGRNLQKYVKERIHYWLTIFDDSDVKWTSMGAGGEDVQLSKFARDILPVSIECKSHAKYAVYKDYAQAKVNAKTNEPIVVIKQNNSKPLAIMDLDYWLKLESLKNVKA